MTPEERAEKLRWMFWNPAMETNRALSLIAAQIREAEKEAREHIFKESVVFREDQAFKEGFNAAKEKAAQIVEGKYWESLRVSEPVTKVLADRIRQMEMDK